MEREFYDAMYRIERAHWWFQGKQKIVKDLLDLYLPTPANRPRHLLDAGCGCGLMLELLQQYGQTEGMDYSDTAIQYCRTSFSGSLIQWDLNEPLTFQSKFDGIVALDVLEHISDDYTAMHTLAEGLHDNGIMVITVPANPWMWSEHDSHCMHQRRYTKRSLTKLCQSSGLEICLLSYYNALLFPPIALVRLCSRLLSKRASGKDSVENQVPPAVLNNLLYRIFSEESKRLLKEKTFPFGVSLIAVLRKNTASSR